MEKFTKRIDILNRVEELNKKINDPFEASKVFKQYKFKKFNNKTNRQSQMISQILTSEGVEGYKPKTVQRLLKILTNNPEEYIKLKLDPNIGIKTLHENLYSKKVLIANSEKEAKSLSLDTKEDIINFFTTDIKTYIQKAGELLKDEKWIIKNNLNEDDIRLLVSEIYNLQNDELSKLKKQIISIQAFIDDRQI